MDPSATTAPAPGPPAEPPPIPPLFGCSIAVPAFAAVLWFMLKLYGPRAVVRDDDEPDPDPPSP